MKGTRACLYLRVSSAEQAKDENKIDGQERACREYAERHGLAVAEVYTDAGYSAGNNKRPAFQRMLTDAKSAKRAFDVILVWKIDRFGRNAFAPGIVQTLSDRGVVLVSITEDFGEGNVGDMNRQIMFAVGGMNRAQIGENAKRGQTNAVLSGRPGGGGRPPFGYVVAWDTSGSKPRRSFVLNEAEADIVTEMFRRYDEDAASIRSLCRWLNDAGVPTPAERDGRARPADGWSHGTVWRMLKNPMYVGDYVYNRRRAFMDADGNHVDKKRDESEWIIAAGIHPAIVTRERFDRVKARLAENEQAPPSEDHPGNALAKIGKCRHCGSGVVIERNGRDWYYYCRNARRPAKSGQKSRACGGTVRKDTVDAALANALSVMLSDPAKIDQGVREYHKAVERAGEHPEVALVVRRIDKLDKEVANLVSFVAQGNASPAIAQRLAASESQRADAVKQLSVLRTAHEVTVQPLDPKSIEMSAKAMRAALKKGDGQKVRDLIGSVVGRAILDFTKTEKVAKWKWQRVLSSRSATLKEKREAAAALDKAYMTVSNPVTRVVVLPRYDASLIAPEHYEKAAGLLSH